MNLAVTQEAAKAIAGRIIAHRMLESSTGCEFLFPWEGRASFLRPTIKPTYKVPRSARMRNIRDRLAEAQNHRCAYCGVTFGEGGARVTLDHVVPVSRGGTDDQSNLVAACNDCNGLRGSMDAYKFFEERRWEDREERSYCLPKSFQPVGPTKAVLSDVWPNV